MLTNTENRTALIIRADDATPRTQYQGRKSRIRPCWLPIAAHTIWPVFLNRTPACLARTLVTPIATELLVVVFHAKAQGEPIDEIEVRRDQRKVEYVFIA
jgi:hypothetical protein